ECIEALALLFVIMAGRVQAFLRGGAYGRDLLLMHTFMHLHARLRTRILVEDLLRHPPGQKPRRKVEFARGVAKGSLRGCTLDIARPSVRRLLWLGLLLGLRRFRLRVPSAGLAITQRLRKQQVTPALRGRADQTRAPSFTFSLQHPLDCPIADRARQTQEGV